MKASFDQKFGPYKKPTEITIPKYEAIQKKTMELARLIEDECPESQEKDYAFTLLKQARMSANEAIAIYNE